MPSFDLRLPNDRAALGIEDNWDHQADGIDTVSIQFQHKSVVRGTHRSRGDTERLILDAVGSSPRPLTRLQIARAVGRAKSPYLVGVIVALVESGDLTETAIRRPNGALEYQYWRG